MSANPSGQFQLVRENGWKRGLGNLLRGEYSAWFKSSRWWKHLLMWFSMINAMMGIMLIASAEAARDGNDGPPLLFMYGIFGGMFVAFGVMIIMQRVLVREKQSGTAAWVLSKPVTRTAFVVSRLVINAIAILLTSVIVPGVILYLTLGLFSDIGWLSPFGFIAGLLLFLLHTFYWIALVLMMGTLLESSGGVIGVSMVLYFVFWYGPSLIPPLTHQSQVKVFWFMSRAFSGSFERFLLSGTHKQRFTDRLSGQISRKSAALKPQIAKISETMPFGTSNLLLDTCPVLNL